MDQLLRQLNKEEQKKVKLQQLELKKAQSFKQARLKYRERQNVIVYRHSRCYIENNIEFDLK
jgi:hypothetical protein